MRKLSSQLTFEIYSRMQLDCLPRVFQKYVKRKVCCTVTYKKHCYQLLLAWKKVNILQPIIMKIDSRPILWTGIQFGGFHSTRQFCHLTFDTLGITPEFSLLRRTLEKYSPWNYNAQCLQYSMHACLHCPTPANKKRAQGFLCVFGKSRKIWFC